MMAPSASAHAIQELVAAAVLLTQQATVQVFPVALAGVVQVVTTQPQNLMVKAAA